MFVAILTQSGVPFPHAFDSRKELLEYYDFRGKTGKHPHCFLVIDNVFHPLDMKAVRYHVEHDL